MLRIERYKTDGHHATEIRALNKSIKKFTLKKKVKGEKYCKKLLREYLEGGGTGKVFKPQCHSSQPNSWGVNVDPQGTAGAFGKYFFDKVKSNVSKTRVDLDDAYFCFIPKSCTAQKG